MHRNDSTFPGSVTSRPARDRKGQEKRVTSPLVAVAYLRVSTEEQSLGPEAQRAQIEAWASREGVQIRSWCLDQGVSGASPVDERPGFLEALQEVEALGAGFLVVAKWDRLGRDVYLSATIERLVERLGAQIQSADGAGNGTGPEQMLMRRLLQAFAEYERALIRSRTRAALRAKRARMERAGGIPLGCSLAPDGRSLETNVLEELALSVAKRLHVEGLSLREIAAELEQQGFKPRGQRWHPQTVARMIAA